MDTQGSSMPGVQNMCSRLLREVSVVCSGIEGRWRVKGLNWNRLAGVHACMCHSWYRIAKCVKSEGVSLFWLSMCGCALLHGIRSGLKRHVCFNPVELNVCPWGLIWIFQKCKHMSHCENLWYGHSIYVYHFISEFQACPYLCGQVEEFHSFRKETWWEEGTVQLMQYMDLLSSELDEISSSCELEVTVISLLCRANERWCSRHHTMALAGANISSSPS